MASTSVKTPQTTITHTIGCLNRPKIKPNKAKPIHATILDGRAHCSVNAAELVWDSNDSKGANRG